MRSIYSAAACAVLALLVVTPTAAVAAPAHSRDQVCVYEHADYGGWEQCYGVGESIRDLGRRRNSISSVRIVGRAEITLYEHPGFGGREITIDSSIPNIRQWSRKWNDETDSLRVSALSFRGQRPDPRERRADRVCVYQHVRFQGNSLCWDVGEEIDDLKRIGWNDSISSIRTFGRIKVAFYEHDNFQGQRLIVEGDIADLTHMRAERGGSWNDTISSVRVGEERRNRRRR